MDSGKLSYGYLASPIGLLEAAVTPWALVALNFVEARRETCEPGAASGADHDEGPKEGPGLVLEAALGQLAEYFAGTRQSFDLTLDLQGTRFQRHVWRAVETVPYGGTVSYSTIATAVGHPSAVRAVGAANGANPISIIIPCHRIVGSDGALTGYGGGLWRKAWLLEHEATHR